MIKKLSYYYCIQVIIMLPFLLLAGCQSQQAKPELGSDKPLPRWVFVHAMGMMPATGWWGGNGLFPLTTYAKKKPPHYFTRLYGGQYRMLPLGFLHAYTNQQGAYNFNENYIYPPGREERALKPRYLKNCYLWDLEQAEKMGVDGFALCLSGNEPSYKHAASWFDTLEKMIAENPRTNVRLTIALCGHELPNVTKDEKKYAWLKRFAIERKDSPAWLRHNNRVVFLGYHSMITWSDKEYVDLAYMKRAVAANKEFLRTLALDDPMLIFDGPEYAPGQISHSSKPSNPQLLGEVAAMACEVFDGYTCWGGVIPDDIYPENYRIIAAAVNRAGKAWMMPILNIHSGIGQFYISKPGVERFLETWKCAERTHAQMAQLVTWNDSNEATSFQPTVSLNYAFSSLTAKFIHKFKYGSFPKVNEDCVYLFYRKYHPTVNPYLYPRATVERDRDIWGETDDMLHVIVFAQAPGVIKVSGTSRGVATLPLEKGYNEFKLKTAVDQEIAARVYRDGRLIHELISPERVTDRPYREDLIPWGWSSDCRSLYDRDFGKDFRPISYYSQRYDDGIPDWFRLHYFGTTELPAGGLPTDDPDGDGLSNLQEYQLGEDPLKPNPVYKAGYIWDELPKALSLAENQQYSARINLNPYPDKNGKLVHAFLYRNQKNGELDGYYPYMMKWVNNVKGVKTGWTMRSGAKHHYYLAQNGGIGMDLLPGWSGIYRFWSPVAGDIHVDCELTGAAKASTRLIIKEGGKELYSTTCEPGKRIVAKLDLSVKRRSEIDFIVQADGPKLASVILKPSIRLVKPR